MSTNTQRQRSRQKNRIPFIILCLVLVLILAGVLIYAMTAERQETGGDKPLTTEKESEQLEKWQEGVIEYNGKYYVFNKDIDVYLMMGIDKDETVQMVDGSTNGGQSDAMFLLVINSAEQSLSVISINRNSMTEITLYDEAGNDMGTTVAQICTQHAFGDGEKASCRRATDAVSKLFFNLPIDGYLSINMGGIPIMNDGVGGVEVTVLQDLSYPDAGVELNQGDSVTLQGMEAYYYLRGRDINEFDSSTYRLRRQEQYITSYMDKLKAVAAGDPSKVLEIYESMEDYIVTNIDFVSLVSELMEYEYDADNMYTVPGETVMGEEFEEYHVDDDALYDLIIQVFYQEVSDE